MRSIAILSTVLSGALAITIPVSEPFTSTTSKCNADNCARAVTGTVRGTAALSSRLAACSTYQSCTISPGPSTVTVTTTIPFPGTFTATDSPLPDTTPAPTEPQTLTPVTSPAPLPTATPIGSEGISTTLVLPITLAERDDAILEARQRTDQCPKAPPAFAQSACGTDGARFRSACSCAGITATTTTALASVTTVSTVTTTPTQGPDPGICFLVIILSKGQAACQCDYETSCGYKVCSLSQRLTGSFNMDTCRDACDARADCRGFNLKDSGDAPFCDLCLSDNSETIFNGTYQNGVRERNGDCVNSQCNLPPQ